MTVSLVSHGHGGPQGLVDGLLARLSTSAAPWIDRVILTQNLPEVEPSPPPGGWAFTLDLRRNSAPLGFGANHNRALAGATTPYLAILNPDLAWRQPPWPALTRSLEREAGAGLAYPVLLNADGSVQDNQRAVLTPAALWRRRVLGRPEARVDWVSAAFWLLRREAFEQLGGFDERYRMYCEDTDFCLRLRLAGWSMARADGAVVTHAAQRATFRSAWHLRQHLVSLARLWSGPVLRDYCRRFP